MLASLLEEICCTHRCALDELRTQLIILEHGLTDGVGIFGDSFLSLTANFEAHTLSVCSALQGDMIS